MFAVKNDAECLIEFNSKQMGGCHRAGTGKNKKVIEISPLLVF